MKGSVKRGHALDQRGAENIWKYQWNTAKHVKNSEKSKSVRAPAPKSHLIQSIQVFPRQWKGQVSCSCGGRAVAQGASEVTHGFHQRPDWLTRRNTHTVCVCVHCVSNSNSMKPLFPYSREKMQLMYSSGPCTDPVTIWCLDSHLFSGCFHLYSGNSL